ncbi:MAG: hypothetical protein K6L75_03535 [Cellvibrionaceae bacterium]
MAIIWRHERTITQQDGSQLKKSYQVRKAGNSLRLYTNGVFHSQYNPLYPIGGTIWDLLALPALYSSHKIKRVLLLGVGGGAVIQQLKSLIDCDEIVGIELDPIHIKIAKKYFKVIDQNNNSNNREGNKKRKHQCKVILHCADAIKWLKEYRGKKFDLIIDDLFFEEEGVPQRAVPADSKWCGLIAKHCHANGTIVMNFDTHAALKGCAFMSDPKLIKDIKDRQKLLMPGYDNRVAAFYRKDIDHDVFQSRIESLNKNHKGTIKKRMNAKVRAF